MKLFVIVICLLSERYLIHIASPLRFVWFNSYLQKVSASSFFSTIKQNPWLQLMVLVLPIWIIVGIFYSLTHHWLHGFVGLLWNLAIFYYCLGPENPFYPLDNTIQNLESEEPVSHYFFMANRQLFAVIFIYIILGPLGLLFYRLVTLCMFFEPVATQSQILTNIFEWIPIRLTALLFLLVGNFQQGWPVYKQLFISDISNNAVFLKTVGIKALQNNNEEVISVPTAEQMVVQALIVALVILAVSNLAWI